jgi:hypothetical protein
VSDSNGDPTRDRRLPTELRIEGGDLWGERVEEGRRMGGMERGMKEDEREEGRREDEWGGEEVGGMEEGREVGGR